jgi:hypothetical protein
MRVETRAPEGYCLWNYCFVGRGAFPALRRHDVRVHRTTYQDQTAIIIIPQQ